VIPKRKRDSGLSMQRWITLIFADWLPHFIFSSRGCLALVAEITRSTAFVLFGAHTKLSRLPLIVPSRRVSDSVCGAVLDAALRNTSC